MKFWERFYELCKKNNEKPHSVCNKLGFSNATATHWKNGVIPKGDALIVLSNYFNVPVDFLLGRKSVPKSKKDMAIEIGADISYAKESLAELEQLVDRITEKVNRLKISLSEVTQTAVEEPTE